MNAETKQTPIKAKSEAPAPATGKGEATCKTEKQLDEEWATAIAEKLISQHAYNKKWTLGGPIKWGMWRHVYEKTVERFKAHGEAHLVEKPLYALFSTWAGHVAKASYSFIGSFELQLWIHSVILEDLQCMSPGKARGQMEMLGKLRDSNFSKSTGNGKDFATICDAAIKFIKDRNSPLVGGKEFLWGGGERFAIDMPALLKETQ